MTFLDELNPKQQEAVRACDGPVLILAGAGSGKTRTIVYRIAYLILQKKVKPWNILAVTFTNKAAQEMKGRVVQLLGRMNFPRDVVPFIGTFHALCVQILRRDIELLGYKRHFAIYDTSDQEALVKESMWSLSVSPKDVAPRALLYQISHAKNKMLTPEQITNETDSPLFETVVNVYKEYQKRLKNNNALDFDDLIMMTVQIFNKYPEVLAKYQKQYPYILVDEYQDTNHAQYELIRLLALAHHNLCVVGDDFQGIYSWRGASIQNILDFEKDYPEAQVVLLEQNYRSTHTIVTAGNTIIAANTMQKKKKLWTQNPPGEKIHVVEVYDERKEGEYVAQRVLGLEQSQRFLEDLSDGDVVYEADEQTHSILDRVMRNPRFRQNHQKEKKKFVAHDIDFQRFAILYRTNAQSRAIEEVFLYYSIPYEIIGGLKFYERREIKDVLAYVRAIANPQDRLSVRRIINIPARGIGDKTWEILFQHAEKHDKSIVDASLEAGAIAGLTERASKAVESFGELMQDIAYNGESLLPSEIMDFIAKRTGYKETILDGTQEGESRWENIQELKTVAQKYDNQKGFEGIRAFLEEVALLSDIDTKRDDRNQVTMMTVHAAKGLEFSEVFLVGMEEGIFPHAQSMFDPRELEEERRLAYVAITRAQKKLHIIHAAQRTMFGATQMNAPSRFIDELPVDLIERV